MMIADNVVRIPETVSWLGLAGVLLLVLVMVSLVIYRWVHHTRPPRWLEFSANVVIYIACGLIGIPVIWSLVVKTVKLASP